MGWQWRAKSTAERQQAEPHMDQPYIFQQLKIFIGGPSSQQIKKNNSPAPLLQNMFILKAGY